jgi:hypothetical protein
MNKILWFVSLCIFVFVTVFVLSSDSSNQIQRVQFTNKNLALSNENNKFENDNINVSQAEPKISSSQVKVDNASTKIQKKEFTLSDGSIFRNSDVSTGNRNPEFSNSGNLNNKNSKLKDLDPIISNANNVSIQPKKASNQTFNNKFSTKYVYRDIDWNTWKSEFVNKILDDSFTIPELDNYKEGVYIQYSFNVYKDGRIDSIKVSSPFVKKVDKDKLARLIKSYEHEPITMFPKNSQRQSAKVSAIMVLSNQNQYSNPNDFNDGERVKLKL